MTDANSQLYVAPLGESAALFLAPHRHHERSGHAAGRRWETAMEGNERNSHGCPLHNQSGADGIKNFDMIVARLSADERAAFEAERAARHAEREHHHKAYGLRP
jgi:hypothetical protein